MNWQNNQSLPSLTSGMPNLGFDIGSLNNWGPSTGSSGSPSMPSMGGGFSSQPDFGFNMEGLGNFNQPDAGKGFLASMLSSPGQQGWGGMALGGASTLASAFMGMQQYGLAKQQLAENKRQFDTNFGAQKTLTNSNLEDRQRARVASNPGAYQSVGDYMNQNGVK